MSQISSMMTIISNTFIIVGVCLLIFSPVLKNVNGPITGYSFIATGLLLFMSYVIYSFNKEQIGMGGIILAISPFILILSILIYSMYLLITYKNKIIGGHVAPGYYNFTIISIILIMIQLFLFYLGSNQKNEGTNIIKFNKIYSMILFLLGIINLVTVITIGIILALFNTDG
jgi:hypothetical protein